MWIIIDLMWKTIHLNRGKKGVRIHREGETAPLCSAYEQVLLPVFFHFSHEMGEEDDMVGLTGRGEKTESGFLRGTTSLAVIAGYACGHEVFPGITATA